ncbi:hypothetical protein [Oryza sativa Japonica Group]|uniref:Uncharacterized protein n=1 Tax=Oryza sativa subsp. japonica TaxID=39947 RepID=Q5ZAH3_ORYSJ|nr:hypothetical protein [Oryza sativa Japonica Group]
MAAEAEADLGFPATATAGGGGATNPRPAPRESGRGRADSAAGEGRWRGAADRGGGRSGSNWDREGEDRLAASDKPRSWGYSATVEAVEAKATVVVQREPSHDTLVVLVGGV